MFVAGGSGSRTSSAVKLLSVSPVNLPKYILFYCVTDPDLEDPGLGVNILNQLRNEKNYKKFSSFSILGQIQDPDPEFLKQSRFYT